MAPTLPPAPRSPSPQQQRHIRVGACHLQLLLRHPRRRSSHIISSPCPPPLVPLHPARCSRTPSVLRHTLQGAGECLALLHSTPPSPTMSLTPAPRRLRALLVHTALAAQLPAPPGHMVRRQAKPTWVIPTQRDSSLPRTPTRRLSPGGPHLSAAAVPVQQANCHRESAQSTPSPAQYPAYPPPPPPPPPFAQSQADCVRLPLTAPLRGPPLSGSPHSRRRSIWSNANSSSSSLTASPRR